MYHLFSDLFENVRYFPSEDILFSFADSFVQTGVDGISGCLTNLVVITRYLQSWDCTGHFQIDFLNFWKFSIRSAFFLLKKEKPFLLFLFKMRSYFVTYYFNWPHGMPTLSIANLWHETATAAAIPVFRNLTISVVDYVQVVNYCLLNVMDPYQ